MATQTFDVGDVAEIRVPFYVGEGEDRHLEDPGAVTVQVRLPTGDLLTPAPAAVREDLGIYAVTFPLDAGGVWEVTITGTDPAPGSEVVYLEVYGRLTRDAAYLEAFARLRALTDADAAPVLTPTELETILRTHQVADAEGRAPGATGYASTFHVNRAAADGWRRKAAKLAGKTDVSADNGSVKRSQAFDHAMEMARLYSRLGLAVTHLTAAPSAAPDRGIVNLSEARLEELYPGHAAGGRPA